MRESNMYNNDKKIIENKNLEMPAESVLEKARAALPEKKEKRRVNRKLIFAIASSFVVIIAVIVSIPYMMPANRALDFVYTSQMQAESIGSVKDYNEIEKTNILCFDESYKRIVPAVKYVYDGKTAFIEEKCSIDEVEVSLLVKFYKNFTDCLFEKEEEYMAALNANTEINGIDVFFSENEERMHLFFVVGDLKYYIKISDKSADWEKIVKEFLK